MSLLTVGSVAFDAIETPFGKTDKIIGGAGTYIALSASFYESNQKNYKNKHLDFEDEKIFKEQSKILYKTLFEKNCLYGFIRNNKSWHSLDVMKINNNYIRKSININFFV